MKTIRFGSWAQYLKLKRQSRFRSAREFCVHAGLGISYPQYSRYESGEQLPSLPQALTIARALGIPALETILEWSRAQILPEHDTEKTSLEDLLVKVRSPEPAPVPAPAAAPVSEFPAISLDEVIVFNRSHLNLFSRDPRYRDIFSLVNSFSPEGLSIEEVALYLEVSRAVAESMTIELRDHGVVAYENGVARSHKRTFYFPDDAEFFGLRNQNLAHNFGQALSRLSYPDIAAKRAYRGLITRELTEEQLGGLINRLDRITTEVAHLPEVARPERVYSLCLLLGQRFERTPVPGLTRAVDAAVAAREALILGR